MLKDIAVNLSGRVAQDFAADYAISVAAAFGAHVAGVAFLYDPVIPDGTLGGVPVDLIEMQREENSKVANAAIRRFEAATRQAGVSAETRILDATIGGAATLFGRIARRFDLAIVGQAQREHGASEELMIEGALFESGRPLVVVPYIQKQRAHARPRAGLLGRRAHRRARHRRRHAVPRARQGGRHRHRRRGAQERRDHRRQHERASRPPRRRGQRQAHRQGRSRRSRTSILSYAADSGADFIVMGGYGHSRLREFILGGVTRGMLASMTVPVLMSH